jgi:rhodanese-related sulfurtransferase
MRRRTVLITAGVLLVPLASACSHGSDGGPVPSAGVPVASIVLDTRTPAEFAAGHVDGAVNMDASNERLFANVVKTLGNGTTYAVYSRSTGDAADAATVLADAGFRIVLLGSVPDAERKTGLKVVH